MEEIINTSINNVNFRNSQGSSSYGSRSPTKNVRNNPNNKVSDLKDKINEITKQISKLRQDREKLSDLSSLKSVKRKQFPLKKNNSPNKPRTVNSAMDMVYNRTKMHHPHLEFILAEVSLSPYMTVPQEKYPATALSGVEKIRELRQQGKKFKEIPPEELPFDFEEVRNTFVNDILKSHEFRKSEEFGKYGSMSSMTLLPASLKRLNSVNSINSSMLMSLSNPQTASKIKEREGFEVTNVTSQSLDSIKKPSKLRREVDEARNLSDVKISSSNSKSRKNSEKTVTRIPSFILSNSTVQVNENNNQSIVVSAQTTNAKSEHQSTTFVTSDESVLEENTSKTDTLSTVASYPLDLAREPENNPISEAMDKTLNITSISRESLSISERPPLSKKVSSSTVDYSEDFHDNDSDINRQSRTSSLFKLDEKPCISEEYSVDEDHLPLENPPIEVQMTQLKNKSSENIIVSSHSSCILQAEISVNENIAAINNVEDFTETDELALSNSYSEDLSSSQPILQDNFTSSPRSSKNQMTNSKSLITESKTSNKNKSKTDNDEDVAEMSTNDDVSISTLPWNHARNIRVQSISNISNISQESVEDFINPPSSKSSLSGLLSPIKSEGQLSDEEDNQSPIRKQNVHTSVKSILPFSPDAVMNSDNNVPDLHDPEIQPIQLFKDELNASTDSIEVEKAFDQVNTASIKNKPNYMRPTGSQNVSSTPSSKRMKDNTSVRQSNVSTPSHDYISPPGTSGMNSPIIISHHSSICTPGSLSLSNSNTFASPPFTSTLKSQSPTSSKSKLPLSVSIFGTDNSSSSPKHNQTSSSKISPNSIPSSSRTSSGKTRIQSLSPKQSSPKPNSPKSSNMRSISPSKASNGIVMDFSPWLENVTPKHSPSNKSPRSKKSDKISLSPSSPSTKSRLVSEITNLAEISANPNPIVSEDDVPTNIESVKQTELEETHNNFAKLEPQISLFNDKITESLKDIVKVSKVEFSDDTEGGIIMNEMGAESSFYSMTSYNGLATMESSFTSYVNRDDEDDSSRGTSFTHS